MTLSRCKQTHNNGSHPWPTDTVLGIGTDLCTVARLDRELSLPHSDFIASVYLPREITGFDRGPNRARRLAACFAAKEAVIKALADAGGQGTFWQDIEIGDDGHGRPAVILHGRIGELARKLGVRRILLSHAHADVYATACAIVSG